VLGWLFSLGLGVVLGVLLAPTATAGVFVGCALATTALGTLMPVLRDTGSLDTPFGVRVLAVGAAGEFGPIVAIALFLSGRDPGRATFVLLAFVALAGFALRMAVRGDHPRMHRLIVETLHSSGQFAVRLVVLVLACMVALAVWLGLDMLLGAFTAGVLVRLLFSGQDKAREDAVESKLEALGFGFLVPLFFVHTGVTYNLHALLHSTAALIMLPVFALLFLLVRGLPAAWAAPDGSSRKDRAALALYGATALPLVVAITDIGVSNGQLKVATASAMVGAGMLSVLLCPIFAMRLHTERAVTDLPVGSLVHESW
jgi:Kef-type K+ transport system membrane component KefB